MSKKAYENLFIEGTIVKVAESGLENLRTKTVADYAGFSEATLFRIFKTKEGLLEEAFLFVDRRLSDLVTKTDFHQKPLEDVLYKIWYEVYRHLVENREETLFLIRYRYSSLYTKDVRKKRQAYNGAFDEVYSILADEFGTPDGTYRGFLLNYIFELTLFFAEKVIHGCVKDTKDTEDKIWKVVLNAAKIFTDN